MGKAPHVQPDPRPAEWDGVDWTLIVAIVLLTPGLTLLIWIVGYLGFGGRGRPGDDD